MPTRRTTSSSVSTLVVGQPVEALGGHAVGAAQVAPVGQRHAQVGGHPAVAVRERIVSSPAESRWRRWPSRVGRPPPDSLDGVRSLAVPAQPALDRCSRSSSCCSRRPPGGSASGSSTGWRTAGPATPIVERNEARRRRPVGRRAGARPRGRRGRRVAAWSRRPGRTTRTTPSSSATGPATAPPGVDVVVPLRDRRRHRRCWSTAAGWPTDNRGHRRRRRPRAARRRGRRSTGWVRVDATGDSTAVDRPAPPARSRASEIGAGARTARCTAASSTSTREDPPAAEPSSRSAELPELGNGPHFFYGLQWWFFGLLAVFGFCYLAYDEWRGEPRAAAARPRARRRDASGSERARACRRRPAASTPVTNDAAGESRKAATRPNSSGSP